ncbi:MAG: hypothetical protein GKR91_10605 [Pseudomonadales bacterium]|nr:hypothetical protein [Pseudomonadales bacterium]
MSNEYCIIHLPARTLATVEAFVAQRDIPDRIPTMFDEVNAWIKSAEVMPAGKNMILYDQFREDGMRMRVGFPVSEAFMNDGEISCTELSSLSTAQVRHVGSYSHLPAVHTALHSWCMDMSLNRAELSIEEYGDWHKDESKLVTNVYVQILE